MMSDEQTYPALIPVDEWRTFRIEEQAGLAKLSVQVAGDGGMVFRIEPARGHEIIEALKGLGCMQGEANDPVEIPESAMTYRQWYYWVEERSYGLVPHVYNPDVNDKPLALAAYDSACASTQAAMGWIDKQYVPDEAGGE